MNSIIKWSKSRTIQTAVLLFVLNGFQGIENYFSADVFALINGVGTLALIYFRSHIIVDKPKKINETTVDKNLD